MAKKQFNKTRYVLSVPCVLGFVVALSAACAAQAQASGASQASNLVSSSYALTVGWDNGQLGWEVIPKNGLPQTGVFSGLYHPCATIGMNNTVYVFDRGDSNSSTPAGMPHLDRYTFSYKAKNSTFTLANSIAFPTIGAVGSTDSCFMVATPNYIYLGTNKSRLYAVSTVNHNPIDTSYLVDDGSPVFGTADESFAYIITYNASSPVHFTFLNFDGYNNVLSRGTMSTLSGTGWFPDAHVGLFGSTATSGVESTTGIGLIGLTGT